MHQEADSLVRSSYGSQDTPTYSAQRSQDDPGAFITRESFWTPGGRFTDFKEHTTIFKGNIIQKIGPGEVV